MSTRPSVDPPANVGPTVVSLFSGIGGIDLAFERAGATVVAQCEIHLFCQRVLKQHFPSACLHSDVKHLHPGPDAPEPDILVGGFPCQDISSAGLQRGLDGERSGTWYEYVRLIRLLRPRFVLVENSSLLRAHLGAILLPLADLGYNAEWCVLPACAAGAPHARARMFIVAYAHGECWAAGALANLANRPPPVQSGYRGQDPGNFASAERRTLGDDHGLPRRLDRLAGLGNAVYVPLVESIARLIVGQCRTPTWGTPKC